MARYAVSKVDSEGKVIKNFKKWREANPDALYHDSKLEYSFYHELKNRKIAFDYQRTFELQPAFKFTDYVTRKKKGVPITDWYECKIQPITWTVDFSLIDYPIVIEAKGRPNDAFPVKLKMFKYHVYMNKLNLKVMVLHSVKDLQTFLDRGLK